MIHFRFNFGVCIFIGLLAMLIAQNTDNCIGRENRDGNIALSALQQYFFGAAACFICAESFATFGVNANKNLYSIKSHKL